MPAQQSIVSQILAQAAKDTREQPWKAALTNAAANKDNDNEDREVVKTGGPLDVLTNFFTA
ncbi:hypothetical protein CJF31_00001061 [Rutstroemia sp. NJR-2017a BVV2]|nr:hypothetical protein CJF31_00001061 [Rutstroemia sp. NJR-2017a BVV2]